MENDKKFESVYSNKVRAGKRRTYFFDVRQTKGDDYYITITESTKRFDGNGYERHKIFLYKEDFNRFLNSLNDTVEHVKADLMPDFDYELYERRQREWEEKIAEEEAEAEAKGPQDDEAEVPQETEAESPQDDEAEVPQDDDNTSESSNPEEKTGEDDMTW